jgi:CBS-domain-containing membrane protein
VTRLRCPLAHVSLLRSTNMIIERYHHVPIVDDEGRPVGVVSMRDIIEYLCDFFRRDILNLPPGPGSAFRDRDGA